MFCCREFQTNASGLFRAASKGACSVLPAGIPSDGILMAASARGGRGGEGGGEEPGLKLQNAEEGSETSSPCTCHQNVLTRRLGAIPEPG